MTESEGIDVGVDIWPKAEPVSNRYEQSEHTEGATVQLEPVHLEQIDSFSIYQKCSLEPH